VYVSAENEIFSFDVRMVSPACNCIFLILSLNLFDCLPQHA
jgi:hypothetical protein